MKHLTKFDTEENYNAAKSNLVIPNVSWCTKEDSVKFKTYDRNPLRFTARQNNSTVMLKNNGTPPALNLEYNINNTEWIDYVYGTTITLSNTEFVEFRKADDGTATQVSSSTTNYRNFVFSNIKNNVTVSGNVISLLDKRCETLYVGSYGFYKLFTDGNPRQLYMNINIPAIELANNACDSMFLNVTTITGYVSFDAYILGTDCFKSCFQSASNLSNITFKTLNAAQNLVYNNRNALTIRDPIPPKISSNTLNGFDIQSSTKIYVPAQSVDLYKNAQYWSTYAERIYAIQS